jgi:hypothetical protein
MGFFFQVRLLLSDFAVLIALLLMVLLDYLMAINTPKLMVPDNFRVSVLNIQSNLY